MDRDTQPEIARDLAQASRGPHDLILVGGGIYGAMLALEATRRGLSPLLLERDDYSGATSQNNLRIVHGGLRYLQAADLIRFRESVEERHWLLRCLPELTRPLGCLMPLYGEGVRRPLFLRAALALNDLLSASRNRGLMRDHELRSGSVIPAERVRELFPAVDTRGLRGGALWYDGFMPDVARIVIEVLRWACSNGAQALNYVEALEPRIAGSRVIGLRCIDRTDGSEIEFQAAVIVNAAGPWCEEFARRSESETPGLFRPSLAWNILFDRPAACDHALAIRPRGRGEHTYFLVPWKGRLLAGTGHAPWTEGPTRAYPAAQQLEVFLADLNRAIPQLALERSEIARIFSGLLPARSRGSAELATRPEFFDHASRNGPAGLYSLSGVKFTTARRVADSALERIFPQRSARAYRDLPRPEVRPSHREIPFDWIPTAREDGWLEDLVPLVRHESPLHLEDLLLRRSALGDNPARALEIAPRVWSLFGRGEAELPDEITRLRATLQRGLV